MLLTPEDQLIFSSVKIHPNREELEQLVQIIPLITNWDQLCKTIIDRGIGPLFFKKIPLLSNNALIPELVKTKLQQAYYRTLSRSMVLYKAFGTVGEAFLKEGIEVIALKGIYLSEQLYKDIGLRQFSDIDLLVRPEDGEKCLAILADMGYEPEDCSVTEFIDSQNVIIHFAPMVLGEISIEIHLRLHGRNSNYAIQLDTFLINAIKVQLNGVEVRALCLEDQLIHLCVHLDKHFTGGHVQFTSFNDITNLLNEFGKTMDWSAFIQRCQYHSCEQIVFKYLILVHNYFNAPLPKYLVEQYANLLDEKDNELLNGFLHGEFKYNYQVDSHWENIRNLKRISKKLLYFYDAIFPPKRFMLQKYGIDPHPLKESKITPNSKSSPLSFDVSSSERIRGHFWWLWYPYRWWIGVKGVIELLKKR